MNEPKSEGRIFDASALLILLNREQGWESLEQEMKAGVISAVNLSEVVAKLAERGMPEAAIRETLASLTLEVSPFLPADAVKAGLLRPLTRHLGLSFGDRACLALAIGLAKPVLTADRVWSQLELGIEVEVVR